MKTNLEANKIEYLLDDLHTVACVQAMHTGDARFACTAHKDELTALIESERNEAKREVASWALGDDTGSSSKSIMRHMLGLDGVGWPPSDKWDRGRCIRMLNQFPEWWERLDEMGEYPDWSEQIPLIKAELSKEAKNDN